MIPQPFRRHGRAGHLFQGRFNAVVLEGGAAVLEVSRYLHLNPVRLERLGLDKAKQRAARAGRKTTEDRRLIEQRLAVLREYRWSSYRAYAGWARGPAWLDAAAVLAQWPEGGQRKQSAYREQSVLRDLRARCGTDCQVRLMRVLRLTDHGAHPRTAPESAFAEVGCVQGLESRL